MSINERDRRRTVYGRSSEMKNWLLVTDQDSVTIRCAVRFFYPSFIIHPQAGFLLIHRKKGLIKFLAYPCSLMQNAHTHGDVGVKL